MTLTVIGSSSEGNAYVLQNADEALLLEAGKPFKKVLEAIDYNITKVVGCLLTHEHKDHAGRVKEYLSNGIAVHASKGTCDELKSLVKGWHHIAPLKTTGKKYEQFNCGNFTVTPFPTKHDCAEGVGFLIWHPETGGILFATDTSYLEPRFAHLSNILIECNYSREKLDNHRENGLEAKRYHRVIESHMSLDVCRDTLLANDLSQTNAIVLIHLSGDHADAEAFRKEIHAATGKSVYIATPGLWIDINQTPF